MPKVLFVCYENRGRSLMGEYLAKALRPEWEVKSAGLCPGPDRADIDSASVQALYEIGIDASGHRVTDIRDLAGEPFDVIFVLTEAARELGWDDWSEAAIIHVPVMDPGSLMKNPGLGQMTARRMIREYIRELVVGFRL